MEELGVKHDAPAERFGEKVLTFSDPDSMSLALVGVTGAEAEDSWSGGPIAAEHAIRGFHGVTLKLDEAGPTGAILTDVLGFRKSGRDEGHVRFKAESAIGGTVDIHEAKGRLAGRMGGGSVHHVAFRAKDDAEQTQMVKKLVEDHRLPTTEQKDRNYFRSVYFHEPGGIRTARIRFETIHEGAVGDAIALDRETAEDVVARAGPEFVAALKVTT